MPRIKPRVLGEKQECFLCAMQPHQHFLFLLARIRSHFLGPTTGEATGSSRTPSSSGKGSQPASTTASGSGNRTRKKISIRKSSSKLRTVGSSSGCHLEVSGSSPLQSLYNKDRQLWLLFSWPKSSSDCPKIKLVN